MSQTIYVSSLLKDKYKDFSPEFFDEINRLKQAGNTVIWDAESILDRAPNINEAVDVIQDYAKKGYKFQINYETLQNRFKNQAKDIADSMKSDGFKVYNEPTEPAKPVVPQVPPSEGGIWDALMAQPRLQAAAGIQALEKAKQLATNPTVAQIAAGAAAPFIGHKPTPETVQHTVSQGIEGLQGIGQAQLALSDKNLYQKALEGLTATSQFQTKRREGQTPNREDFVTDLEHLAPAMRIVNLLASQVYAVPQVGLDFADSVMQMALSPASEKFKGKSKESQKWERPLGAGMEMVNQVVSNLAQNAGFSKEFSDELGGIGGFAFLHYLTKGARELKDMRGRQRAEAFQTRVRELEKQMDESVAQAAATVSKSTEPTEKIPLAPEIQSPEAIASLKQEVPIGQEVQGQEKVIPTELKPIVEGGQNAENVRLNQEVTPQKPPELAAVQGQIGGGGNLREAQAEGGGGYPNLRGAGETPPQEVAPTEVPAPTYVGAGKPKTYTNIVDPMHPDVGFRLKLERALFGEGNLFPGESRLHRLWQKAGADFSNRVNRFMYSVEKLQKIAGEKLPDAKNPWTRYVNFLGLNNKFFDTMENGPIDPANPFRRMSEGPMHIIDRLPEIQGQPVIDSYKEAMQYGVAKRTLAEKQRAIDAANQEPDLQTRDRALKEVEAKDAANRFSGIGEGKMPDTAKAQEIIAAVDANPLKADVYSDFANRYKQIGDSLIDYAVKRGRISAEQGTAIKDSRDDYVSFKRVYDQIFRRQAFGSASNAPGQDHAIMHRYEGSDRIIEDPMVNLMQMTYDIMKESDLNRVRQDYVDLVDTANQVDPRVGNSILWEVPNKSEGTMTVYKNGQPHYYAGETMLMKQFKGLEGSTPSDNIALNAMRTAAQIFKGSVTHSPPFAFMNWMRAAVEYPLLSTAVTNPLQSVASTLDLFTKAGEKKASEAAQYGLGAQWYMKSRENFYKRQQTAIRELSRAPGSIVATDAKKLLEAYNKITDVSELGPRMAEFNKVLENEILRGADYESAMMKASAKAADLPNFALAGNLMQSLNRYVPFTNPAVQSVKTFVKAIYTHPVKAAATFATFMLLPRVMEYQWAAQNEERLRRWQNRPAHERDMFLNFELPSGRNEQGNYAPSYSVNLPIGFEFSVLSSGLSRMMDQVLGKNQMAFDGWDQSLKNALVPVDPDMFMSSLVGLPSELLTGYDAFQRRFFISPEEAKLPPEYRSGAKYASALGKAPAKSWNWALESMKKLTGKDLSGYKVDPRNIDQIIRRMGGRFGTMAQSLSNVATGQRGAESLLGSWVGLIRQLPAYAASDVNIVQQAAENTGQAAELDKLRKMKDMWYAETDPEKKNKILNDLLKYTRFLRDGKLKLAIEDPEEYMRRLGKKKSF